MCPEDAFAKTLAIHLALAINDVIEQRFEGAPALLFFRVPGLRNCLVGEINSSSSLFIPGKPASTLLRHQLGKSRVVECVVGILELANPNLKP